MSIKCGCGFSCVTKYDFTSHIRSQPDHLEICSSALQSSVKKCPNCNIFYTNGAAFANHAKACNGCQTSSTNSVPSIMSPNSRNQEESVDSPFRRTSSNSPPPRQSGSSYNNNNNIRNNDINNNDNTINDISNNSNDLNFNFSNSSTSFPYRRIISKLNFKSIFKINNNKLEKLTILFKLLINKLSDNNNNNNKTIYIELLYVLPLLDSLEVVHLDQPEFLSNVIKNLVQSQSQPQSTNSQPLSEEDSVNFVKKKARRCVNNNEVGKAMTSITNFLAGDRLISTVTPSILSDVKALFPSSRNEDQLPVLLPFTAHSIEFTEMEVTNMLKRLPASSAAGLSPWSFQLIRKMAQNDEDKSTIQAIKTFLQFIANGQLYGSSCFLNCRLFLIRKQNHKVRPIGIPDCWMRITSKIIAEKLSHCFDNHDIQFGVKVPGGTENIIHRVSNLLKTNPNQSIGCFDISNAFNCIHRQAIYHECDSQYLKFIHFCYSSERLMVLSSGESIPMSGGTIQGDPLSPVLFSMGLMPVLRTLQDEFPELTLLAYLDDITIVGDRQLFLRFQRRLQSLLSNIGLQLNVGKSQFLYPESDTGMELLGIPTGSPTFISQFLNNQIASIGNLLNFVDTLDAPISYPLIYMGVQSKVVHLIRQISPSVSKSFCKRMDKRLQESIIKLSDFHVHSLSSTSATMAALPVKLGGLGISNFEAISKFAWCSSVLGAIPEDDICHAWLEDIQAVFTSIGLSVSQLSQHDLVQFHHTRCQSALLDKLVPQEKAFYLSSLDKGASAWLRCGLTSTAALHIEDPTYRRLIALKLFMEPATISSQYILSNNDSAIYNNNNPAIDNLNNSLNNNDTRTTNPYYLCSQCGESVPSRSLHGLLCSRNQAARTRRHTYLRQCTLEFLVKIFGPDKVHSEVELRGSEPDGPSIRADIVVESGVNSLVFDITVPCCASVQYLSAGADRDPKITPKLMEREKVNKYSRFLTSNNIGEDSFYPIVFESSGRLGERMGDLSDYIGKLSRPTIRSEKPLAAYRFYLARARTALARSNGNMLRFADQCRSPIAPHRN